MCWLELINDLQGTVWHNGAKGWISTAERLSVPKQQIAHASFPESKLPTKELNVSNNIIKLTYLWLIDIQPKFVDVDSLSPIETARQIAIYSFRLYVKIVPSEVSQNTIILYS